MQNYTTAFPCWSASPHVAGHYAVGGTVRLEDGLDSIIVLFRFLDEG